MKPERRNSNVGSRLFEYAENALRGEAEFLMLSTAVKNWRAILRFYIDELGMEFWSASLYKHIAGDGGKGEEIHEDRFRTARRAGLRPRLSDGAGSPSS